MAKPRVQNQLPCICENCQKWANGATPDQGTCRAKPPVPMFLGMDEQMAPVIISAHPPTKKNGWCGEHEMVSLIQTAH